MSYPARAEGLVNMITLKGWYTIKHKPTSSSTGSDSYEKTFFLWIFIRIYIGPLAKWVDQEDGVQSQVESYQRLKTWYMMPPCLTLSIIRKRSRVKWSNPRNGIAPSPTPRCSSYWKGSLRITLTNFTYIYEFMSVSLKDRDKWRDREIILVDLSIHINYLYDIW